MKKLLTACFLAIILVSCDGADQKKEPKYGILHVYHLRCGIYDIEFRTTYHEMGDSHEFQPVAIINGQNILMEQEVTASGVRYDGEFGDAPITLRNRGNEWKLKVNNERPSILCTSLE